MNKIKFLNIICVVFLIVLIYSLPQAIYAAKGTAAELITAINTTLTTIGTTIVIIGWVIAGILYLTASGSQTRMSLAKTAMVGAIIGTILIILSTVAKDVIDSFLK